MSPQVPEVQLRQREEGAAGCTVYAFHILATVWPGRPMTPQCRWLKEGRPARKRTKQHTLGVSTYSSVELFLTFSYDFYSVTSLSSETLPLLCVTFITENSLIAAVSIQHNTYIAIILHISV